MKSSARKKKSPIIPKEPTVNPAIISATSAINQIVYEVEENRYKDLYEKYMRLQEKSRDELEEHVDVFAIHSKKLEDNQRKIFECERTVNSRIK